MGQLNISDSTNHAVYIVADESVVEGEDERSRSYDHAYVWGADYQYVARCWYHGGVQ